MFASLALPTASLFRALNIPFPGSPAFGQDEVSVCQGEAHSPVRYSFHHRKADDAVMLNAELRRLHPSIHTYIHHPPTYSYSDDTKARYD